MAEHRLVLESQVAELLGASAPAVRARLRALSAARCASFRRIFDKQPACCQITRKGLAMIGSKLPPPRLNLAFYRHDVGVAWLWLAARRGAFGPLRDVLGERRLRSHDGVIERAAEPRATAPGP